MVIELEANEIRVLGCLLEKAVITPEQYPLTLNALTAACNQKSSRDPVLALAPGEVQRAARALEARHLVRVEENFRTQVEKYAQRFCNTAYSEHRLDPAEYAILTVLLLRGPRTPGELRANSGRLHAFPDNEAVEQALQGLLDREGGALVTRLPRRPGRRDREYAHLLGGPVQSAGSAVPARAPTPDPDRPVGTAAGMPSGGRGQATPGGPEGTLEARVARLEHAVGELRRRLDEALGD